MKINQSYKIIQNYQLGYPSKIPLFQFLTAYLAIDKGNHSIYELLLFIRNI